jgi:hypothetical protein
MDYDRPDIVVYLLRFILGFVIGGALGSFLVIRCLLPVYVGLILSICVAVIATIFGDKFILLFVKVLNFFKWL